MSDQPVRAKLHLRIIEEYGTHNQPSVAMQIFSGPPYDIRIQEWQGGDVMTTIFQGSLAELVARIGESTKAEA